MDAVKFLKELRRMCQNISCSDCSVQDLCSRSLSAPQWWEDDETKEAVETVEKWSAEHPVKTRLMDFLEKYPNAPMLAGIPRHVLPKYIGYCSTFDCLECEHKGRTYEFCWNLPLEE
jgi:hypothetical protein